MTQAVNPRTAATNGLLWGHAARDWAEIQENKFDPGYHAAFAAAGVGPGTRLLDVGCGAGGAARIAAGLGAVVAGIDAAEALLDIARERMPDADFRSGDLEALPFPDAAFDVVTGFNAFQFAGNPPVALAEARRVTRAGGRVVVMLWAPPEGMPAAAIVGALKDILPPPPPGAAGFFALSEEPRLRAFAEAAGLRPLSLQDVDCPWVYPDEATAVRGLGAAGVAARAAAIAGRAAVEAAFATAIAPFRQPDGSFEIGARCRILVAEPA